MNIANYQKEEFLITQVVEHHQSIKENPNNYIVKHDEHDEDETQNKSKDMLQLDDEPWRNNNDFPKIQK